MHHVLHVLSLWMTLADLVEGPAPVAGMQVFAAESDDLPDDEAQPSQAPAATAIRR
jgi:hypothetical protein